MAINSEVRKAGPFTGNDTTTVFPFTFKVFTADQVGVVLTNSSGNERYAVQGTEYTVTLNPDQNTSPGGLVQIPAPLATGDLLTITSHVPYLQHMDLTNHGGFYPAVLNAAMDRATIQIQQLNEQVGRAVKTPVSSGSTPEALVNELLTGANVATAAAERATEGANYVASQEGNIATVVANIPQLQAVASNVTQLQQVSDSLAEIIAAYVYINNLASGEGAANVGYDSGTAQDVLDSSKPMHDYTALRNYSGRATGVRLTKLGIAGAFQRDDADTTSADNGGTTIVDSAGRRWKRAFDGGVYVDWFGAAGDGIADDSNAAMAARAASSHVIFSPGKTYKMAIKYAGAYRVDAHGAKFISADKSKPMFENDNTSWDFSVINGGEFDGVDKTGVGISFGDNHRAGRLELNNVSITRCRHGVLKPHNIGGKFNAVNIHHNVFGFVAKSQLTPEGGLMHAGCDVWNGGNASENDWGIVYLNRAVGFGQVQLNGTVLQYNGINGLFYSSSPTTYGGFNLQSVWDEGAYLKTRPLPDLIFPEMAGKEWFDGYGKYTGPIKSVIVHGTAEMNGAEFGPKAPYIERSSAGSVTVRNALIVDSSNGTVYPNNVFESASVDCGVLDADTYAVDKLLAVSVKIGSPQTNSGRGASLIQPPSAFTKISGLSGYAGKFIVTHIGFADSPTLEFSPQYPGIAQTLAIAAPNDSYRVLPDLVSAGVLVTGMTITRRYNAAANDVLNLFLRINSVHAYGQYPRFRIPLSSIPLNSPTRFVFICGASIGDNASLYMQRAGTGGELHFQDVYEYTVSSAEDAVLLYNNRLIPSLS